MEFVLFMLFVVIGYLFFDRMDAIDRRNSNEVRKKCHEIDEIHDWSRHPMTEKLVCCKCNYEAGSDE